MNSHVCFNGVIYDIMTFIEERTFMSVGLAYVVSNSVDLSILEIAANIRYRLLINLTED